MEQYDAETLYSIQENSEREDEEERTFCFQKE